MPIPFTFRFPGKPLTEESDWQEHVIAHLGLDDWQRVKLHEELDLLGDVARRCLTEIGLMWPATRTSTCRSSAPPAAGPC